MKMDCLPSQDIFLINTYSNPLIYIYIYIVYISYTVCTIFGVDFKFIVHVHSDKQL